MLKKGCCSLTLMSMKPNVRTIYCTKMGNNENLGLLFKLAQVPLQPSEWPKVRPLPIDTSQVGAFPVTFCCMPKKLILLRDFEQDEPIHPPFGETPTTLFGSLTPKIAFMTLLIEVSPTNRVETQVVSVGRKHGAN